MSTVKNIAAVAEWLSLAPALPSGNQPSILTSCDICRLSISHLRQSVNPLGGIVEHRRPLVGGKPCGQLLKLVPKNRVRTRQLVYREVTFEHTSVRPELIEHVVIPVTVGGEQLIR